MNVKKVWPAVSSTVPTSGAAPTAATIAAVQKDLP